MRNVSSALQALVDSDYKESHWLFTVTTLASAVTRWSTAAVTYDGEDWTAEVIPDSFNGIELTRGRSEFGIQAPNHLNFDVTNSGESLTASDYEGATVLAELYLTDGITEGIALKWKFRVRRCYPVYQKLSFICEDFLQQKVQGKKYPKGKLVSSLSEADKGDPDDNLCVPTIFGNAYIPIRSAFIAGDARYYVLGTSVGVTYDIKEIAAPRDLPFSATWSAETSNPYTFTQSTKTLGGASMRVFQPIIADSDLDGDADASGFWIPGQYVLDPRVKFTKSDTETMTSPEDIIDFVLRDMGIPDADIDNDSGGTFASAGLIYAGWGLEWGGGLYFKEQREAVLARMCSMSHSVLDITDRVELRPLSATSVITIDKSVVRRNQFQVEPILETGSDSAYIAIPETGKPQDELHKILVSALEAGTTSDISDETLELPWVQDTEHAQILGTLHFQRKFRRVQRVRFLAHSKCMTLQPDDVATIDHADYGGTYDVLVDSVKIRRDLSVEIEAIRFSEALLDWGDLSPAAASWSVDSSTGVYHTVISGPDGSVTSGALNNVIRGRLRLVSGNYEIHFDPTDPAVKFYDSTILRASIGKIGAANYGVAFYDVLGNETIAIDATRKVIKEMQYEMYTAGIIQTNADIASNGGWAVGPTQQIAYNSSGQKTWQVVHDGTDEGDWYAGKYDLGLSGWKYDASANQAWYRGDLAIESIPGFPDYFKCYLDLEMNEGFGSIVHDGSRTHATGTFNAPFWTSGILGSCARFNAGSSRYVAFGTNANWDVLGDMAWSFWIYVPTEAPASTQYIAMKGEVNVAGWVIYLTTSGKIGLGVFKSGGATYHTSDSAVTFDEWNHMVFAYNHEAADAGTITSYLNGEQDGAASTSVVTMADGAAYNLNIGCLSTPGSYLVGRLQAFKLYNNYTITEDNVKTLYKYPQGVRGGQLTARSVMVGTPDASNPGVRIDDTGLWMYGAAGAELFGFCISSTITWNSQTLTAGKFVIGDYNGASGMLYDGNFAIKVSASDAITMSGGTFTISAGYMSVTVAQGIRISGSGSLTMSAGSISVSGGSISITSLGAFSCAGASFEVSAGTASISTTSGLTIASGSKLTISSSDGILLSTIGDIIYGVGYVTFRALSSNQVSLVSVSGVAYIEGSPIYAHGNINPDTGDTYSLGTSTGSSTRWNSANINTINYCTPNDYCASFYEDGDKCVSILQALRPLYDKEGNRIIGGDGNFVLDKRTLVDELTNKETLFEELREEMGKDYSYAKYIEEWDSGKFERSRSGRNTDHLLDVVIGALVYNVLPRIWKLEK